MAAFSVAPSTSPSGCFSPVASMPTAATRIRSSWTCRPSIWIASRSRDDRSRRQPVLQFRARQRHELARHRRLRGAVALGRGDIAVGQANRAPEPPGRDVDQHLVHRPPAQPVLALARGKAGKLQFPLAIRRPNPRRRCRPGRHERPPGSWPFPSGDRAVPHGAGGAPRTDRRPRPPGDPGTLRSRPADRRSQSCSEPPGTAFTASRSSVTEPSATTDVVSRIVFVMGVAPLCGFSTPSLPAQGSSAHLRSATSTGTSPLCRIRHRRAGQSERHGEVLPVHPEDVLFDCGRPVLVIPYAGKPTSIGERVVVGWNASREAARAVNDALPLLETMKRSACWRSIRSLASTGWATSRART